LSRFTTVLSSLATQPSYTLMRGAARFSSVRTLVAGTRSALHDARTQEFLVACEKRVAESWFTNLDRTDFVQRLRDEGIAFGLRLPQAVVEEIRAWADQQPCYADRDPALGFRLNERSAAEQRVGKPILLAQYFNTTTECPAISRLAADPVLRWVAASYLGSLPSFVGANLWWTFPVHAREADREKHAHVYHRDVDDFRFFKFFFYLTDVAAGEGAHVCVVASHRHPPELKAGDRWNIRRYSDDEIRSTYPSDLVREICGDAGTGFAENTLCIHKGSTPKHEARLLLQLQFALFDYGAMHDRRAPQTLAQIA
jgi:hypothetical protein